MKTITPKPATPTLKPDDIVRYANPQKGEEAFRFIVAEIRGDRVLIRLLDLKSPTRLGQFHIAPSECVPLSEVTLALVIVLHHAPRFETGGYDAGKPSGPKRVTVPVGTLKDAALTLCAWRKEHNLGGSNFAHDCGHILDGKTLIAKVSYNGRVWTPDGKEVTL